MPVLSTCPSCNVELATQDYDAESIARCAACGSQFSLDAALHGLPEKNTKATASAILGGMSFLGLFLTGVPAIILGWLALKDIREKKTTGGKSTAITGIVLGSVLSLLCGGTVIGLAAFVWQIRPSDDPVILQTTAAFIGTADYPEEVEPQSASSVFGMRTIGYTDRERGTRILHLYYPKSLAPTKKVARSRALSTRLGLSLKPHGTFTVDAKEGPVEVTEERGTDDDGDPIRMYTSTLTHPDGWVVFQIRVQEEPADGSKNKKPRLYLSKDQLIRVLETFEPGPN